MREGHAVLEPKNQRKEHSELPRGGLVLNPEHTLAKDYSCEPQGYAMLVEFFETHSILPLCLIVQPSFVGLQSTFIAFLSINAHNNAIVQDLSHLLRRDRPWTRVPLFQIDWTSPHCFTKKEVFKLHNPTTWRSSNRYKTQCWCWSLMLMLIGSGATGLSVCNSSDFKKMSWVLSYKAGMSPFIYGETGAQSR